MLANLLVMFLHLFQAILVYGVSTWHNRDIIHWFKEVLLEKQVKTDSQHILLIHPRKKYFNACMGHEMDLNWRDKLIILFLPQSKLGNHDALHLQHKGDYFSDVWNSSILNTPEFSYKL